MLEMKASRMSRMKVTRTPGRLLREFMLCDILGKYEWKHQES
jgi:hypothetical protein